MTSLVADIGGTNTRVALAEGPVPVPGSVRRFRNADHPDLTDVLAAYLAEAGSPEIDGACAALAGPVRHGRGKLTNLDWIIEEDAIARVAGTGRVKLLNDMAAQGHALDHIAPGALETVLEGPAQPGGPRLVIGIGTGFNAAAVHALPHGTLVTEAEAGQVSLPVGDAETLSLARFLAEPDGFAPVEEALSGRGLGRLYDWATAEAGTPRRLDGHGVLAALDTDPEARRAAETFVRLLGTVAGDLALNHLPYGGIYLIGGMACAVTPLASGMGFAEAFRRKGRFAELMRAFRVLTVTDDSAALTGCAGYLASAE
ncbi:hypothetical protein BYZ73_01205 [Rhodovulum viride]|uniref:Glucokinase n=1 Tax=Rhodovulum viride TaxID=1231134 RepID=A0ABX9DPP9_9RHOB|nr:glucokinase [Rhodovulum viride]RAP43356.1 hypothetical protein BYZ73_01205 [Rhodovulum viride]